MSHVRATGYLRPPTESQVLEYAERHHLHLSKEEVAELLAGVPALLEMYNRIEEIDVPSVRLRHTHRDPGHTPVAGEDPYNAIIRFCEVRGESDGRLANRTIGVKDCIAVAGVPMTNGGRRTPASIPTYDAVVVERMLDAGATITAKTNLDDLGLGMGEGSAFGAAKNPINPKFSTGGSSSGSAAAVSAGQVDMAIGVDSGGSVRVPAAWCGLVGMKATHGLVPSYGITYMDHTIDHVGPITKSVMDNALLLDVIAGEDWRDPQWSTSQPVAGSYASAAERGIEGLRIGVVTEALEASGCTEDVLGAFEESKRTLVGLGAEVVEVSIPLWCDSMTIAMGSQGLGLYGMALSYGMGFGHLGRVDPDVTSTWAAQMHLQADDLPPMLMTMLLTTEHLLSSYQGRKLSSADCWFGQGFV